MPNTKSAIRRTKRNERQALVNKIRKSKYKAAVKQMTVYLKSGKINEAKSFSIKLPSLAVFGWLSFLIPSMKSTEART